MRARTLMRKMVWMAKSVALLGSFAVGLALILGVATTALAAVPGDPLRLGQTNTINNAFTKLVGSNDGDAMLTVDNNSSAGGSKALNLRVEAGKQPINVNSDAGKATNLNADELDGKTADDFISEDKTYTETESDIGPGAGTDVQVLADCDSGDRILGGGGGALLDTDILLRGSEPTFDGWKVVAKDGGSPSFISAKAICADFPPLR